MSPSSKVTVRRVGPESAATVLAIVQEAFGSRPPLHPPADALGETEASIATRLALGGGLVARVDGEPVGALLLDAVGDAVYLRRFGVLTAARGHGVLVAMDDRILSARDVVKTSNSGLDTFRARDHGPLGDIDTLFEIFDKIEWEKDMGERVTFGVNNRRVLVKEAAGVVGVITPWNVPLYISIGKIIPALLAGCTSAPAPAETTEPAASGELPFAAGSIAALGDSISVGVAACGQNKPCPSASWTTGEDETVDSRSRLLLFDLGAGAEVAADWTV